MTDARDTIDRLTWKQIADALKYIHVERPEPITWASMADLLAGCVRSDDIRAEDLPEPLPADRVYLVYRPGQDKPEPVEQSKPFTLEELQALVGGYIQILPGPEPGTQAVMNEEGKLEGLERNAAGTDAMNAAGLLFPGDWIAGVLVIAPDALIV